MNRSDIITIPFLKKVGNYHYFCRDIKNKTQYLKKLPKDITKEQAQKLFNKWLPRYEKQKKDREKSFLV